jgi:hypothetical protein
LKSLGHRPIVNDSIVNKQYGLDYPIRRSPDPL